jgi:hypothetical protein
VQRACRFSSSAKHSATVRTFQIACAAAVVFIAVSAVRDGHAIGAVGVAVGVAGAVAVWRARALVGVVAACALVAGWAVTRAAGMPDEVFWRHLEVQRAGQGTLVIAWAALVTGLLMVVPPLRWRRWWVDVIVVVVLTSAWASHPMLAALAALWALGVAQGRAASATTPPHPVLGFAPLVVGLLVVDVVAGAVRTPPVSSSDAGAATRREIARDNPWRALAAAHAWAATGDGQGLLAVARIAASLGLAAEADDALAAIEAQPQHRMLWSEAASLRATLASEPQR